MITDPTLRVELGSRSYPVLFQRLSTLASEIATHVGSVDHVLVVTDENVVTLYLEDVLSDLTEQGIEVDHFVISAGEASKSHFSLEKLYDWALDLGVHRGTPLIALGGGVVGDLTGFAAATLLRGLPLIQCPTTVIAQVDSAIGGKTGINHTSGKNLIGAFHQPSLVLADTKTLESLPERERIGGLSEVVKHAVIADSELVQELDSSWDSLLDPTDNTLASLIPNSAGIKASIVSRDERESGVRAILNFGHTFGHAIERVAGYGTLSHGEAVAIGMRAAMHLSASVADMEAFPLDQSFPATLRDANRLIDRLGPPNLPHSFDNQQIIQAMTTDKKRTRDTLRFVVLERTGEARIVSGVPTDWVELALTYARSIEPDTVT